MLVFVMVIRSANFNLSIYRSDLSNYDVRGRTPCKSMLRKCQHWSNISLNGSSGHRVFIQAEEDQVDGLPVVPYGIPMNFPICTST